MNCTLWTHLTPCVNVSFASEAGLPAGTPSTSEAEFEAITAYFQPPSDGKQFNVVRHERL
jgi:hypothetical protein